MKKYAIVVGASSGIGRSLVEELVLNGYQVGVTGRRKNLLKTLVDLFPEQVSISCFDATDAGAPEYLDLLLAQLGTTSLDLFVMNAGVGTMNPELEMQLEKETVALNVDAFTSLVNWAYQLFKRQKSGHLVGVSSVSGLRGMRFAPAYCASKSYQINYLASLQHLVEKERLGFHITDVRPGFVDTAMAQGDHVFWRASTQKAARQIMKGIRRKKRRLYVTRRWALIGWVLPFLPSWLVRKI